METGNKEKYERLADIILEWNEKINVTAIRDRGEFMKKNIEDSLAIMKLPEFSAAERILDLGTGGGFPGLPLAIACPEKQFFLLDSVAKKLKVVAAAADELGLENVDVLNMRAEDLAKWPAYRESFDLVVSRAVANMSTLSEYCLPFVKKGGYFVAYKTREASAEIEAAAEAVRILGGGPVRTEDGGSGDDGHIFAVVEKTGITPGKYPRKAGLPSRQPLFREPPSQLFPFRQPALRLPSRPPFRQPLFRLPSRPLPSPPSPSLFFIISQRPPSCKQKKRRFNIHLTHPHPLI